MLNQQGYVAECTADNIFTVYKGEIITPAASQGALKGITRATIFDIAKELNIPMKEADLTRYDVWCADECFLTGTGAEVIPVTKLDGRVIGHGKPGPITGRVLAASASACWSRARGSEGGPVPVILLLLVLSKAGDGERLRSGERERFNPASALALRGRPWHMFCREEWA
jgi:hypothetical protein